LKEYIVKDCPLHLIVDPLIPTGLRIVSVLEMKELLAEITLYINGEDPASSLTSSPSL